jgi:hypothetical protein
VLLLNECLLFLFPYLLSPETFGYTLVSCIWALNRVCEQAQVHRPLIDKQFHGGADCGEGGVCFVRVSGICYKSKEVQSFHTVFICCRYEPVVGTCVLKQLNKSRNLCKMCLPLLKSLVTFYFNSV